MEINNHQENEHYQWSKNLERYRQENALLKYRLSDQVDKDEENHFLQKAEYFQNELLIQDEMLKKLIKGSENYKKMIENKLYLSKKITVLHERLKTDILKFEKQFFELSREFNEQMLQHSH